MPRPTAASKVAIHTMPGHHVRRLQQIAVAIFLHETAPHGLTPVQYAALQAVHDAPGLDQRSLARTIAFDTSTIGSVLDRLERRGLLARRVAPGDRRVRRLEVTDAGRALLAAVLPGVRRAQRRILAPLPPADRAEFTRMLRALVEANNAASRAPGG